MNLIIICLVCFLAFSVAFIPKYNSNPSWKLNLASQRRTQIDEPLSSGPKFTPGKDLPEEISKLQPIYDMILIERINAPQTTATGIILPVVDGKDQKKTGVVVSLGRDYGLESEQGRLLSIQEIAPYNVGDTVYVRDPWGVGSKDITVGERSFSFIKADHILSVMK